MPKKTTAKKPAPKASPKTAKKKATAARVRMRSWRARALKHHFSGWSFAQIATLLGMSASAVREGIDAELAEITGDYTDRIKQRRETKSAQLDAIIKGSMPAARKGIPNAAFVVIAAVEKQIKLHGLAAAEKIDINAALTLNVDAHTELLGRLQKLATPTVVPGLEPEPDAPTSTAPSTEDVHPDPA